VDQYIDVCGIMASMLNLSAHNFALMYKVLVTRTFCNFYACLD